MYSARRIILTLNAPLQRYRYSSIISHSSKSPFPVANKTSCSIQQSGFFSAFPSYAIRTATYAHWFFFPLLPSPFPIITIYFFCDPTRHFLLSGHSFFLSRPSFSFFLCCVMLELPVTSLSSSVGNVHISYVFEVDGREIDRKSVV